MDETGKISTRTYQTGDIVIEEGDRDKHVFVIISGSVEIYKTENGSRQLLNTMSSGEIFGEMGLLTDEPRYATVIAAEETRVIMITDKSFHAALLNEKLPIIKPLTKQLVLRCKEAEQRGRKQQQRIEHLENELAYARERLLTHEIHTSG